MALDTEGAFGFLRQAAPLLSGAGFGVLLPDWVRKSKLGLKLTTRSKAASSGSVTDPKFGLQDLVDFRYDLAVGDQELDPDELAELARLKVPLVRLRGQWVELDDRHLRAALQFLERSRSGTMRASDALLAAGLDGADDDLPLVKVDADGWLGDLLSGQADRRLEPVATPASFTGTLRPYQERGVAWLSFLGRLGLGVSWRMTWAWVDHPAAGPDGHGRRGGRIPAARARPLSWRPRCWSARCRWSATGSGKQPNSRRI